MNENYIRLNFEHTRKFTGDHEMEMLKPYIDSVHEAIADKAGAGSEFLGWADLPETYDEEEFKRIKEASSAINAHSDVLVVIGIGGSYLGAKAALEMLKPSFENVGTEVIFAGHHLSAHYMNELKGHLKDKDFSINVISKSGTTTEPAIAFRIFKQLLEEKYENTTDRIYITTDRSKGALKKLADTEGYATFTVPDDIGGRYSVLTAVGLLPMAASGIDIDAVMAGAGEAKEALSGKDASGNPAYRYAAMRNILYRKGYHTELFANYDERLKYFSEWWKQLFGESEGKDGKGIMPHSANFTTDLHSLGQYIQDGRRGLFETVLAVETPLSDIVIESEADDLDGLNYLAGMSVDAVNKKAVEGTVLAHVDGGVPNILITVPDLSPRTFGHLVYFFELSCAMSGYLLGVNPFDQPGVEAYKENMFALLGKPGFEALQKELNDRLT
ncbi:glucose-6-phosphate isomerase [Lacicoccus alkaliphilus]|uniref:Glucose-6-phosphate isomerase n=1 Tax=Lacicoccus alkaliphilus DSM 16010 TaxID=1123231 RepID=A0A1M7FLV3_9BACL|nr:glucose-6-phosphate isomerase [Salinicoccus alkaliphilus]SHM04996.1 glucose-6-phosphate isomerase [Salinicoccus alkaliphilus DSM 16010]